MTTLKVGKRSVDISNEDKILFPKTGITKGEIIKYYQRIAPRMVPYMKDHPLAMQRFPSGIAHESFFQKNTPDYFPSWITTKTIKKKGEGSVAYVVCDDAATLVYLANQGCLTPHLWLSKTNKLRYPDRMIFDLDPSGDDFSLVIRAAKLLKKRLEADGLKPFVMTTGSRGLHVVVPLKQTATFDKVRAYARALAQEMAHDNPQQFTIILRKKERKKRVFIDYLRNSYAATGVAPYAVRPKEGAPVATPLAWTELTSSLTPQKYTIKNIFSRLSGRSDPWRHFASSARSL